MDTTEKGPTSPSRGAVGGASNEAGAAFRSGVAAWIIAHGLQGSDLPGLRPDDRGVPDLVSLETDDAVDDIAVTLSNGSKAFFQAKSTISFAVHPKAEFPSVVRQWKKAVVHADFNPTTDRLVLAVQTPSQPIKELGRALFRYKAEASGAYTAKEDEALTKLRGLLGGLSDDHQSILLHSAGIIVLNVGEDGIGDAGAAQALLDGTVVESGQGRRAWHELKRMATESARHREGRSIHGWTDALRSAGLTLIADADKSTSARHEATRLAESRYRQLLVARGSMIDLRGLGYSLPPLPTQEVLSRISVSPGHEAEDTRSATKSLSVVGAIRRRGRTLLLGLPGSGKSTALAMTAAHWAARTSWPLPVLVDAKGLLRRIDQLPPLDNAISMVSLDLDSQDRVLIKERIAHCARTGMLAIFLDGLDQTQDRRVEMVRYIERLLQQIHQDNEIVIATRDVGYAQAATLSFKELRLLPPEDMTRMIRRTLEALATENPNVQKGDRAPWVATRMTWLEDVLERDPHLKETPLIPILIALLAAQGDQSSLPQTRAQILSHVVDNLARRWEIIERRQNDFEMGALTVPEVADALLDAFECVGYHLVRRPQLGYQEAAEAIALTFRDRWGMPMGRAEAAAKASLSFWDEAGIIVASGPEATITARVTLFAEIAAARYLADLPQDKRHPVLRELLSEDTSHEAAALAAGLSPQVASTLIQFAAAEKSLDWALLAARGIDEGAAPASEALEQLINLLVDHIRENSQRAWEVAKSLVRVPVPDQQRAQVLVAFTDCLPGLHSALARALATMRWDPPALDLVKTALRNGPPKAGIFVDSGFTSLVELAAEQLLPTHAELAPDIADGANRSSVGTAERVFLLLERHGHGDLVERRWRWYPSQSSRWLEAFKAQEEAWDKFLRLVASSGTPKELEPTKTRRLDDLADFIATLDLVESSAVEVSTGLLGPPESIKLAIEAVVVLGGFDPDVLASLAQVALEEQEKEGRHELTGLLYDDGKPASLTRWNSVKDSRELEGRLVELLGDSSLWLAGVAADALREVPDRHRVVRDIDSRLAEFGPRNRDLAARVIAYLDQTPKRVSTWESDPDGILRRVAARLQASLFARKLIPALGVVKTLSDPDAGVRESVLEGLHGATLPNLLAARIREVTREPGETWTCKWCGHANEGTSRSCEACRTVGPDPEKAAQLLLGEIGQ